jgi:hypothetical protein
MKRTSYLGDKAINRMGADDLIALDRVGITGIR